MYCEEKCKKKEYEKTKIIDPKMGSKTNATNSKTNCRLPLAKTKGY